MSSPLAFALLFSTAALCVVARSGEVTRAQRRLERGTLLQFLLALAFAASMALAPEPPRTLALGGAFGLAGLPWLPTLRLDGLSALMAVLVSGLGWTVARYVRRYLAGDPAHGPFVARLGATLSAVGAFVLAGDLLSLALLWLAVGLGLDGLLLHRRERAGAWRARQLRRLAGSASVGALLLAAFWAQSQNGSMIPEAIEQGGLAIGGLLSFAAIAMSVQPPFHRWLLESLETVTPVSALMHAGIVNAGGFLVLRCAPVFENAPVALLLPLAVGTLTAAVGSVAMLTRSDVKGKLASSTVAQMGFMLMQCGLGAFGAAALHLVAHGSYKAYAFLASGTHVVPASQSKANAPPRPATLPALAQAAIVAPLAVALGWWITGTEPSIKAGGWTLSGILGLAAAQILLFDALRGKTSGRAGSIASMGFVLLLPAAYFGLARLAEESIGLRFAGEPPVGALGQALVLVPFLIAGAIQVAVWIRPDAFAPLYTRLRSSVRRRPAGSPSHPLQAAAARSL